MVRRTDVSPEFDTARMVEVEEENGSLRDLLKKREEQGGQIADLLADARNTIAGLQGRRGMPQGEGMRWFLAELWSFPRSRLALLACTVALRLEVYARWYYGTFGPQDPSAPPVEKYGLFLNLGALFCASFLFCKWAEAEYRKGGPAQLVMKCGLVVSGFLFSFSNFFGGWWIESWFRFSAVWHSGVAFTLLLLTTALVMSNFTERLAEKTSARIASLSKGGFLSNLVGWFV